MPAKKNPPMPVKTKASAPPKDNPSLPPKKNPRCPLLLMILDGFGVREETKGNAIKQARTPNLDRLRATYPNTTLKASGEAVGVPAGQMGNSEVGHLTIGLGRIVDQPLLRINKAIASGEFQKNKVILDAFEYVKKKDTELHLIGLVSDGGVHSHIDHLLAILDMAKSFGLEHVFVHAFLDGRDTPPRSAGKYLEQLEAHIKSIGLGKIALIAGRYYAMDRDGRWLRTKAAFDALREGEALRAKSAKDALAAAYERGENDEFVQPTIMVENNKPVATIDKDEMVFFFNFRPDRARQLSLALAGKLDLEHCKLEDKPGSAQALPPCPEIEGANYPHLVTMMSYEDDLDVPVAFPPERYKNPLGEVLSKRGYTQLRIAETEKYAHVTYFFNGGSETKYPGMSAILVPSPKVRTYDLQPEMNANEVTQRLLEKLDEGKTDVIILNFANPDMVGHTGKMDAAIKAIEVVDGCIGRITEKITKLGGTFIITSDHGNAEVMMDPITGGPFTAHTTSPVPFILSVTGCRLRADGGLSDIAPTMLSLLGERIPREMNGRPLME